MYANVSRLHNNYEDTLVERRVWLEQVEARGSLRGEEVSMSRDRLKPNYKMMQINTRLASWVYLFWRNWPAARNRANFVISTGFEYRLTRDHARRRDSLHKRERNYTRCTVKRIDQRHSGHTWLRALLCIGAILVQE